MKRSGEPWPAAETLTSPGDAELMRAARVARAALVLGLVLAPVLGRAGAQEPSVRLDQGTVVGVKIFPESSRVPIDAFLGIPYASPPIGHLRFAAPEKHKGWKGTLYAQDFGPSCLQAEAGAAASTSGKPRSEDCLFINIWAPELTRGGGKLPVVLVLQGDSFGAGAPLELPGTDLAAEGLLVATAAWRLGPLGFLCLGGPEARGNLGILDQYLALLWLRENVARFGGDPHAVTLMGHSAGATSVLYHMISPRTKALFSRAIIMSGSMWPAWQNSSVALSSRRLASAAGCLSENTEDIVQCLREKSTDDIFKAFRTQHQSGNWTDVMVPVVDTFLDTNDRYIPVSPLEALTSGNYNRVPVLTGLTDLEAADSSEQWEELARQGYPQLKHYVEHTAVPGALVRLGLDAAPNARVLRELLAWEFADRAAPGDAWGLLRQLQRMHSELRYEAPLHRLLALLRRSGRPLYVYRYRQTGGVDLHGRKSNSTGAAHGSELPYLFGPTLFQQLTRRRLTQQEERLSKRMRVMWSEFVKFGYPTPPRQYDAWAAHTEAAAAVQVLGAGSPEERDSRGAAYWGAYLPRLANLSLEPRGPRTVLTDMRVSYDGNDTVRHAMYTLLGLVVALVALLVVCVVLLKRTSKERQLGREFGTF